MNEQGFTDEQARTGTAKGCDLSGELITKDYRTIYLVTEGPSDYYSVRATFESKDDAVQAVADGLGDAYYEIRLYAPGKRPKKTTVYVAANHFMPWDKYETSSYSHWGLSDEDIVPEQVVDESPTNAPQRVAFLGTNLDEVIEAAEEKIRQQRLLQ